MTDSWGAEIGDLFDVAISTDDASIMRRRRALAPIQAITDIDRNKAMLEGDHWAHYDLFTICLAVIDQVALAMGISAGRTWDATVDYATGQAARQRPDAPAAEHRAVADRVLVSLVTTDVETVAYVAHTDAGAEWRAQRFRLLYVHASGADGAEHLRASEQAINVFIDALDLDIEAAQIANEAQLAALISRGAFDAAVQVAVQSRYRSIQYQEQIRRVVADTLIDPDTHDWAVSVPELLDRALSHIAERLASEAALLDAVSDRRHDAVDRDAVDQANRLVELLRECRHRHDELHTHLITSRSRLRAALDDRFSRPARVVHRFDLGRDLLDPYLARTTTEADPVAGKVVAVTGGLPSRWWPTLAVATDELCAPPRAAPTGDEFEPADFVDDDTPEWWEPYEDAADDLLAAVDEPIRLSQLLVRAVDADLRDSDDEPLDDDLVCAALTHAAHRAWAVRLSGRAGGDRVVVAVTTGSDMAAGGVRSDDLLLVPGTVISDVEEPDTATVVPHPTALGRYPEENLL